MALIFDSGSLRVLCGKKTFMPGKITTNSDCIPKKLLLFWIVFRKGCVFDENKGFGTSDYKESNTGSAQEYVYRMKLPSSGRSRRWQVHSRSPNRAIFPQNP